MWNPRQREFSCGVEVLSLRLGLEVYQSIRRFCLRFTKYSSFWHCFILAKTFQLLRSNHKNIKEELKSISKCICDELNIRSTPPALYSPTSIHRSLDKHLREEEQEKIRKTRQHLAETPESNPILPHPCTLRCKYTIRCLHCLESNMSGMLLNPQIQPLLGDSSLFCHFHSMMCRSKANEIWNRVANLAVLAIPVLSIVSVDDECVVLSVRNVLLHL